MNDPFQFHPMPTQWIHFPEECLWYLVLMSIFHLAVFIIGCLILTALTLLQRRTGTLKRHIGRFGLFITLFLFVGSFFNGLWSCLVYNRLYHSTDYIFDFIPFWPISWRTVDTPWGDGHGALFGISLFQLELVWLLFAISTWAVTIFLYRIIRRHSPSNLLINWKRSYFAFFRV